MNLTLKMPRFICTGVALAAAFFLSGCASEPTSASVGTGIESVSELRNLIRTEDGMFKASLEALSLQLNACAAAGVSEVNLLAFSEENVAVDILTDSEESVLTSDQLSSVLSVLAEYDPPTNIAQFEVKGWDKSYNQGDAETAARELGINARFINADWHTLVIPGDQIHRTRW